MFLLIIVTVYLMIVYVTPVVSIHTLLIKMYQYFDFKDKNI